MSARGLAGGPVPPSVVAHQTRTPAPSAGPIPLWDTTWWISLEAARSAAPLTRIEYTVRFIDGSDPRPIAGGFDLGEPDRDAVNGRVLIVCPTRPDYERRLRVQVRLRDAAGAVSGWAEAEFPVRSDAGAVTPRRDGVVPLSAEARTDRPHEPVGTVEVEATDETTIGEAKAMLQRGARAKGGDAVTGLRIARSTPDRLTFAADVIRYLDAQPAATPTPIPAPSERVLGEIVIKMGRR